MANKNKGIKSLLGCDLEIDCKACRKYDGCLLKAAEISSLMLSKPKSKRKPWVIEIE